MKRDTLLALADRCEREEPSHRLDDAIWIAVEGIDTHVETPAFKMGNPPNRKRMAIPHYTTSLDAAVTLRPDGFAWNAGEERARGFASLTGEDHRHCFDTRAKTPALAFCAAALRARAALAGDDGCGSEASEREETQ